LQEFNCILSNQSPVLFDFRSYRRTLTIFPELENENFEFSFEACSGTELLSPGWKKRMLCELSVKLAEFSENLGVALRAC